MREIGVDRLLLEPLGRKFRVSTFATTHKYYHINYYLNSSLSSSNPLFFLNTGFGYGNGSAEIPFFGVFAARIPGDIFLFLVRLLFSEVDFDFFLLNRDRSGFYRYIFEREDPLGGPVLFNLIGISPRFLATLGDLLI
jgi:hypothetical protein